MSARDKIGTMPTPYGVTVDVFECPGDPEGGTFSMEGTALLAGIHSAEKRAAFAKRVRDAGRMDLDWLDEFGGGAPPRIALQRPSKPVYPTLPRDIELDVPVEAFVTMLMDRHRWCDRAAALLPAVNDNLAQAEGWQAGSLPMPKVMGLAMGLLVTGALEHLHEQEIDCIEAAAIYALCEHPQWRDAGLAWLEPFRKTWFQDWRDARPAYARWAAARIEEGSKLPAWLAGEVA